MTLRQLAIGTVALLAAVAALSAISSRRANSLRPHSVSGSAPLHAYGSRSLMQRQTPGNSKLDATLADLSSHASRANPDHWLADLHSLSPAAHFAQSAAGATPLVLIDAITRGDPQKLKEALVGLGLQRPAVYSNDVGGWLPVSQIATAAASAEVHSIRAAMSHTSTGAVTSQGDFAQKSDVVRATYPTLTGSGVTVGVLSDSFNCYAVYAADNVPASGAAGYASNGFLADAQKDMATGDLPSIVNVIAEPSSSSANSTCLDYGAPEFLPFTDEGRAMLQIVHDVAPGASLAFYTADNSEADFANGIGALAKAGAKVEADDAHYFDEPFYQDGILAQAIDAVAAQGVAYFSSAGNNGQNAWESAAPSFATLSSSAPNANEYLLNFDTSGATTATSLPVTIPALVPGEFLAVVVQWDQPYVTGATGSPGATSHIDLCVTGTSGGDQITDLDGNPVSCTGPNATGSDPLQVIIIGNPANASGNTSTADLNIMVGLANGTTAPHRVIVAVEDDGAGSTINAFTTNSETIQGHPGAAGAAAVGAAFYFQTPRCGTTPAVLETFSSAGGAPILFDTSGNALVTPQIRQKPDFVGPDAGNDTFLGFTLASDGIPGGLLTTSIEECQNNPNYPNFFGTSAATPHAASIAALMLQANPTLTPAQIYSALQMSALPMSGTTPNNLSGYGFVQADAALALVPAGAPTLSLSETTVAVGASAALTWSSVNTQSCAASGSWSGAQATSGSLTITPTAVGTLTYTLTCGNSAGSALSSVSLKVTAASTSGGSSSGGSSGGGGALESLTLLALAALGAVRLMRRWRGYTACRSAGRTSRRATNNAR